MAKFSQTLKMPAPDSQRKDMNIIKSLIAESNGLSFWLDDGFTQFSVASSSVKYP